MLNYLPLEVFTLVLFKYTLSPLHLYAPASTENYLATFVLPYLSNECLSVFHQWNQRITSVVCFIELLPNLLHSFGKSDPRLVWGWLPALFFYTKLKIFKSSKQDKHSFLYLITSLVEPCKTITKSKPQNHFFVKQKKT